MAIYKRYGQEITSDTPEHDAVSYSIVVNVLDGMTFDQAGKKYGMTRQASNKRFWLSVVNRPFKSILGVSTKDIKALRIKWIEFLLAKI